MDQASNGRKNTRNGVTHQSADFIEEIKFPIKQDMSAPGPNHEYTYFVSLGRD